MRKELTLDEMQHIEKSLCWNCDRCCAGVKEGVYAIYCFEFGEIWFDKEISSPNNHGCFQCSTEAEELEIIEALKSFEMKLESKRRSKMYDEVVYDMKYNGFHCEHFYETLELALIHFGKESNNYEDLEYNMRKFIVFENMDEVVEYFAKNEYLDGDTFECMAPYISDSDMKKMFEKELDVKSYKNKFYKIID